MINPYLRLDSLGIGNIELVEQYKSGSMGDLKGIHFISIIHLSNSQEFKDFFIGKFNKVLLYRYLQNLDQYFNESFLNINNIFNEIVIKINFHKTNIEAYNNLLNKINLLLYKNEKNIGKPFNKNVRKNLHKIQKENLDKIKFEKNMMDSYISLKDEMEKVYLEKISNKLEDKQKKKVSKI